MSLELLSPESEQLYAELKGVVIENAEKVGLTFDALARIRDGRLYRAEFKTFAAFCQSIGKNTRGVYRMLEDKPKKPKRVAARKPLPAPAPGTAEYDDETELMQEAEEAMSHVSMISPSTSIPTEAPILDDDGFPRMESEKAAIKVRALMERLSIKPVIDAVAQECLARPLPDERALHSPEEYTLTAPAALGLAAPAQMVLHEGSRIFTDPKINRAIAVTELKAWAEKRRAENDATSEEDAAWADYIARQIIL